MKKAFSLIELLLAIVIVGIGVAALPYIGFTSSKGNAQTILSEVVTSSRIYIDDILLEPWNSALATGFIDESGAKVYSGVLETEATDARFTTIDGKTDDGRLDTAKALLFNRTLAKTKVGDIVKANAVAAPVSDCYGLNCTQNASAINAKTADEIAATGKSKNAFAFNISANTRFINVTESFDAASKTQTVTFSPSAISADSTTNAIMIEVNATAPLNETTGLPAGNLLDDVNNITLRSFSFNIGSEPQ